MNMEATGSYTLLVIQGSQVGNFINWYKVGKFPLAAV